MYIIKISTIFLGVAMMGMVTGRIASFLMERQMNEEKGLLNYEKMKDHFIICGFGRMGEIIAEGKPEEVRSNGEVQRIYLDEEG